jgi:hypothetical protein
VIEPSGDAVARNALGFLGAGFHRENHFVMILGHG